MLRLGHLNMVLHNDAQYLLDNDCRQLSDSGLSEHQEVSLFSFQRMTKKLQSKRERNGRERYIKMLRDPHS
jgi:hypothetical protein